MKNTQMKKRIASLAAAAVMSMTSVAGTFGFAQLSADNSINTVHAASSSVTITKSLGYQEGAYVEWTSVSGATGYNVYCDGVQLDSMLIRQYSGYFRADAVGLKAGSHTFKVVPVSGGTEISSAASSANVTSTAHDRSGFAFVNGNANGAYNSDGTLKSNAVVVYVTEQNKDSVTASLNAEGKGNVDCVGIVLAAIGMVSCMNTDEVIEVKGGDAIAFADVMLDNAVRAAVDPSTTYETIQGFNVWGFMDDVNGVIFEGDEVTRSGETWTYSPTQYWAPSHTYYFAALSPIGGQWTLNTANGSTLGAGIVNFVNNDGSEASCFLIITSHLYKTIS